MKLRAKANGDTVDLPDSEAEAYLSTGLYDRIEPTKVEPLTTTAMPTKRKKAK